MLSQFVPKQLVKIKKMQLKINTEEHRQQFSITPHSGAAGKNKWTKSHTYCTQQAIPIPTSYATKRTRVGNTANSWKIQRLKAECNRDTGLGCILKQHCTCFDEQKHGYSLYDVALLLYLLLSFVQNASLVYCVTCLPEQYFVRCFICLQNCQANVLLRCCLKYGIGYKCHKILKLAIVFP